MLYSSLRNILVIVLFANEVFLIKTVFLSAIPKGVSLNESYVGYCPDLPLLQVSPGVTLTQIGSGPTLKVCFSGTARGGYDLKEKILPRKLNIANSHVKLDKDRKGLRA